MRVCALTDKPEHPLLAGAATVLTGAGHQVDFLNPGTGPAGDPSALVGPEELADVYLLKAHTPRALTLARSLEARGARVVNSARATALCQDRKRIAGLAADAGLPVPRSWTFGSLACLPPEAPDAGYPFMAKSRHNRRDDLVARVDGPARLRELAAAWPDEPVVLQEFVPNSGWDHKLWVIAGEVFTGVRPAPVGAPPGSGLPAPVVRTVPDEWTELALRVGAVFGLEVYGVDLLDREAGPVIVDVNAFPGVRGPEGAAEALAALAAGDPCRKRNGPGAGAPRQRSVA